MNSFMSWVGGKKALREEIVRRFPLSYERYIEVFGGGGCRLFMEEALDGNALAMHDLGRMFVDGTGVEADTEQAHAWYAKALSAFQTVERQRPNRYVEYRIGKMYAGGLGTEQRVSQRRLRR